MAFWNLASTSENARLKGFFCYVFPAVCVVYVSCLLYTLDLSLSLEKALAAPYASLGFRYTAKAACVREPS